MKRLSLLLAVALVAVCASAQDIASFEKRIAVKTLPNGLTILICERPEAPVFSFFTMVGERGITLSGGQKQRTAIARALVRNPRILILDDALSSVDTYTEEKILNHLREVMRGRTTIFISHRVSTVRNADRIAVLHGGRIVEFGTHDELLAQNGYYTDLYNKQLLEEELETV